MKKVLNIGLKIIIPLLLGGGILYWIYRDFDFSQLGNTLSHDMNLWWLALSLVAGVMSHVIRGWRWMLTLAPLDMYPKRRHCVYAIFIAYAANLIIPRVGEVSRCSVLDRYDGISFSKSLGTVVMERLIDTLCVVLITLVAVALQANIITSFINSADSDGQSSFSFFTSPTFFIIAFCVVAICVLLFFILRKRSIYSKIRNILKNVWEGFISLKKIKNLPLFLTETVAIWACYFLQFYLCFNCFDFTDNLPFLAGLVLFVAGSIAVVVPTPNGIGPWHFAVISIMVLYGVSESNAALFALIVHSTQTLLVVFLGIIGLLLLQFEKRRTLTTKNI